MKVFVHPGAVQGLGILLCSATLAAFRASLFRVWYLSAHCRVQNFLKDLLSKTMLHSAQGSCGFLALIFDQDDRLVMTVRLLIDLKLFG